MIRRVPLVRDPWGMRLGDLRASSEGSRSQWRMTRLRRELRTLIEDLLATRWVVGQGGEAAVHGARSLLEPYGEREWVSATRGASRKGPRCSTGPGD